LGAWDLMSLLIVSHNYRIRNCVIVIFAVLAACVQSCATSFAVMCDKIFL